MTTTHPAQIRLKNVSLTYDLHLDRTNNLKEFVVNLFTGRKYVSTRKQKINAIDNLSLDVNEGDRLGIIGLNGSGKSTTLKVISGILKPTKGTVEVQGTVQPLIEIGAGFDPEFTGRENIYLNGYMLGFTKAEIRAKEKEIIEFADLGDFIDSPIKYYSSGMSVRLAFTIATSIKPEILVFDEMLAAGDAQFMARAKTRIDNLMDRSKIIVIVSHDMGLIESTCNRVIVLNRGQRVFEGSPKDAIAFYDNQNAHPTLAATPQC